MSPVASELLLFTILTVISFNPPFAANDWPAAIADPSEYCTVYDNPLQKLEESVVAEPVDAEMHVKVDVDTLFTFALIDSLFFL